MQSTLREDSFLLISERQDFGSDPVSIRTVGPVSDKLDLQSLDLLINGSSLFKQGFVQGFINALGHPVHGILAHPVSPVDGIDGDPLQHLFIYGPAVAGIGSVLHPG